MPSAEKISDKALQVVDRIVKSMPEKEKENLFNSIVSDKKTRDHVLKILMWTYSKDDLIKDVGKREHLKHVVRKIEKEKARKLKHAKAMEGLASDD